MYKTIFILSVTVASSLGLQAQEFQGMAVYESKTSSADFKTQFRGNKGMTPAMQKMVEESMKKMFEKTFILNFDKSASIYKEEVKLEELSQSNGMVIGVAFSASSMTAGGGTYYKNVKDKFYIVDKEFMGKEFLVKDSLPDLKWKIEDETRVIGGYNCFKATAIRPVSQSDLRNFESNKEKRKAVKSADTEKKTNFIEDLEMPAATTIIAWYTPEIPISQGPENYWGLPGLILEVNDGKTVILCSKIVLNPKEKTKIKAPTNGKLISQKEFDETVFKKMEEMKEMNQGRGKKGLMITRMGG